MTTIRAVPNTYRGVRFRSTLEADWAATLDYLGIAWQYEPEAVQLPSGALYRPDFYLPECTTWLEVKGPHDERLEKTLELGQAAEHCPDCDGIDRRPVLTLHAFNDADAHLYASALSAAPDGDTAVIVKRHADAPAGQWPRRVTSTTRVRRRITYDHATAAALNNRTTPPTCCEAVKTTVPWRLVVIGRAAIAGNAVWESAQGRDVQIIKCVDCGRHSFFDQLMSWVCRRCQAGGKVYHGGAWVSGSANGDWDGHLPFVRAPKAAA